MEALYNALRGKAPRRAHIYKESAQHHTKMSVDPIFVHMDCRGGPHVIDKEIYRRPSCVRDVGARHLQRSGGIEPQGERTDMKRDA